MANDPFFNLTSQLQDKQTRGFKGTSNSAGVSSIRDNTIPDSSFLFGMVVRSGAGAFDAEVRIDGRKTPIPCIQPGTLNGWMTGHGYTHSQLIQEGTIVLLYLPSTNSQLGVIIGPVGPRFSGKESEITTASSMLDLEGSTAEYTEKAYSTPLTSPKYQRMANVNAARSIDLYPGETSFINEAGCGLALLAKSVKMQGSDRSKIQCFYLDDLVRILSGQYQHFSDLGEHHIYNDYGYVTEERVGSPHQCNVMGLVGYGNILATEVSPDYEKAKQSGLEPKSYEMVPHRRFHSFFGHLGGMFQMFFMQNSPTEPSVYGDMDDRGIAHVALDDCGRLTVRTLSDIIFERTNMIALPRKNKEPWHPEGDKIQDDDPFKEKKPFKWDTESSLGHPLQQRDYFAWARKLTYQRFFEVSDLNGKKDWILKEEADAPKPDNKYDTILQNEEDYSDWEERTAFFMLGKDGTISMRNNKGAEISLVEGNIEIMCPGSIRLRSGESTVVLAGDDFIAKARNSADITATEKDVRLKSNKNLQLYSKKSVLIEAGEDDEPNPQVKGEQQFLPEGIILRAREAKILLWADVLQLTAKTRIILEGLKSGAARLIVALKEVISFTEQTILMGEKSNSGTFIGRNNSAVWGKAAYLIGGRSAGVTKAAKYAVPLMWANIQQNPYQELTSRTAPVFDEFYDDDEWLGVFSEDLRKDYAFTYRSDQDYKSPQNTELEIYEAFWQYVARNGGEGPSEPWKEEELRETYPWPGARAYSGGEVLKELKGEVNIEDPKTGIPVSWKDRVEEPEDFNDKGFDEYKG